MTPPVPRRFEEMVGEDVRENLLTAFKHPRAGQAGGQEDGQHHPRVVPEAENHRAEAYGREVQAGTALRLTGSNLEQGLPVPAGWLQAQTHLSAITLP